MSISSSFSAAPRFGYALLHVHPAQRNYTRLTIVDDPKRLDPLVDNDSLYLYGYNNDLAQLSKGLNIPTEQFQHVPHGNSDFNLFKIDSFPIRELVRQLNTTVAADQEPTQEQVQQLLSLAKTQLKLTRKNLAQWVKNIFDLASWKPQSEFYGPNQGFFDQKAWNIHNLQTLR